MKNFFERIVRWYLCNCIYVYVASILLILTDLSGLLNYKDFIISLYLSLFVVSASLMIASIFLYEISIKHKKLHQDEYIISLRNNLDWIHRKAVLGFIPKTYNRIGISLFPTILFVMMILMIFGMIILLDIRLFSFSLDEDVGAIIVLISSNLIILLISLMIIDLIISPLLKIDESLTPHQSEEEARYEELRTRFAFHNITKDVRNLKSYITILKHEEPQLLAKFTTLDELTSMVEDTLNKFKNSDTIRTKKPFLIHELFDNFLILNKPDLVREGSDFQIKYEKIGYENMEIHQIFYEVYQILNNLIDNSRKAIAQTERKEIQVYISVKSEGFVHFQVSDTGVGIDEKVRDRVFDIGYSTTNGDGLGLLFVQTTLKRLEGEIQLLTTALSGFSTTFEVKIPV